MNLPLTRLIGDGMSILSLLLNSFLSPLNMKGSWYAEDGKNRDCY